MSKTRANAWGGVLPQLDLDIPMPPGAAVPRYNLGPRRIRVVKQGGAFRRAGKDEGAGPRVDPTAAQANSRGDES